MWQLLTRRVVVVVQDFAPNKKREHFIGKKKPLYNRDIRKVRKRQHYYPEFGHTQGE